MVLKSYQVRILYLILGYPSCIVPVEFSASIKTGNTDITLFSALKKCELGNLNPTTEFLCFL